MGRGSGDESIEKPSRPVEAWKKDELRVGDCHACTFNF
jgi:hypothetical protein